MHVTRAFDHQAFTRKQQFKTLTFHINQQNYALHLHTSDDCLNAFASTNGSTSLKITRAGNRDAQMV